MTRVITKQVSPSVFLCKNGRRNWNTVQPGFRGIKDFRYHPTKGYRRENGFSPAEVVETELEKMIETSEYSEDEIPYRTHSY